MKRFALLAVMAVCAMAVQAQTVVSKKQSIEGTDIVYMVNGNDTVFYYMLTDEGPLNQTIALKFNTLDGVAKTLDFLANGKLDKDALYQLDYAVDKNNIGYIPLSSNDKIMIFNKKGEIPRSVVVLRSLFVKDYNRLNGNSDKEIETAAVSKYDSKMERIPNTGITYTVNGNDSTFYYMVTDVEGFARLSITLKFKTLDDVYRTFDFIANGDLKSGELYQLNCTEDKNNISVYSDLLYKKILVFNKGEYEPKSVSTYLNFFKKDFKRLCKYMGKQVGDKSKNETKPGVNDMYGR